MALSYIKNMKKIEELKKLVEENGTEKMKRLLLLTEDYLKGLDHLFNDRDISEHFLRRFDLPMFIAELKEKGTLENVDSMNMRLLIMDIYYIARHTWELVDKRGNVKNGDDLRKAWPEMYEEDDMLGVTDIFNIMLTM